MAAEITIQPGSSIQTAVNNAASGDIITVKPGTYTENLQVSKDNLTIRSESGNPDDTIIKAKNTGTHVFLLQGNNIKINGFKILGASKSSSAGVNLSSCSNCMIQNNKILDNSRGIYLLRSRSNMILKNSVTNCREYGIALQGSTGITVSENTAKDNQRGIYLGTADDNIISSNTVQNNSVFGFFICGLSDRNHVYNNYFNNVNMTIRNGSRNSYNTTKTAGTNIIGGPYIGGNFWGKPDGTGFSQTAVDKDGDGISDSAYTNIAGSIYSDYLPLTTPGSILTVPVADFSSNVTSGAAPLSVSFTDKSTGTPTSWNWNFGDGTASTQQNPVHTYSTSGNYTVKLTATNAQGNNTITKTDYIKVTASNATNATIPVVSFWGSKTSGTAPLTITFTDASTNIPTAWYWSFGDGTNSTVKKPTHTYTAAGNYTVTLNASNAAGTGTKTRVNYIKVTGTSLQIPVAAFSALPTSGSAPLNVSFTDASTGSPTAWSWNFGDGTVNSTVQNPTHTYSTVGNFTVTLTATNAAGSNAITKSKYIIVTGTSATKPVASFSSNVTSGNAPLNVLFSDKSTGSPTAWSWSFGDGTSAAVQNPVHTYSTKGNYTVTLAVSNAAGNNTVTKSNYITVTGTSATKPVASFSSNVTSGPAPLNVAFTDASTGAPTAWSWSFGDGTANSTIQNPTHTYSSAGNYTIALTATNAAGSNTVAKSNYITVTGTTAQKPVLEYWGSPRSGTAPLTVYFKDNSTGSPTAWNWSFGDGTANSTIRNPVHVYSAAGSYTIKLTVTNAAGSTSGTKNNYIVVTSA